MSYRKSLLVKSQCLAAAFGTVLLAVPAPLNAQTVNPCRQLGRADTVVIIEASNNERLQLVNQVVNQHNLQGNLCTSRRTGRTVWMSNQLDGASTAMQVFDYFKSVGLGAPGRFVRGNGTPGKPMPSNPNSVGI